MPLNYDVPGRQRTDLSFPFVARQGPVRTTIDNAKHSTTRQNIGHRSNVSLFDRCVFRQVASSTTAN